MSTRDPYVRNVKAQMSLRMDPMTENRGTNVRHAVLVHLVMKALKMVIKMVIKALKMVIKMVMKALKMVHESSKNGHESSKKGHESSKNGHKNGHESSKKGHEKIHWKTAQGMQVTPAILADILCMPISDLDNLINEMPPHALQNLKLAIEYIFLCHVGVNSEGEPTRLADMKSQKLFYRRT